MFLRVTGFIKLKDFCGSHSGCSYDPDGRSRGGLLQAHLQRGALSGGCLGGKWIISAEPNVHGGGWIMLMGKPRCDWNLRNARLCWLHRWSSWAGVQPSTELRASWRSWRRSWRSWGRGARHWASSRCLRTTCTFSRWMDQSSSYLQTKVRTVVMCWPSGVLRAQQHPC